MEHRGKYINPLTDFKLFTEAEIARLTPEEMRTYDESQKIQWDNYSILQTVKHDAIIEVATALKKNGASVELIVKSTGLTKEEVEAL